MEHRSKVVALALTVYSVLNLMLSSGAAEAQEKIKFPVGVGTKNHRHEHVLARREEGFLRRFRLEVQPVLLHGTAITMQALVSESLLSRARVRRRDHCCGRERRRFVGCRRVVNGLTQAIVAGKNYKSIKDLRGATIGVQVLTSGATNVLKRILKNNGLDYPADYKLLAVGGGSFNLAALTSGQIGATYLVVPLDYDAERQGFNILGYFRDYFPNYQLSFLTGEARLGRKKSYVAGPLSQRRCARPSLALRQQRSGDRFSCQGNSA